MKQLVFDLEGLEFITSAGIRVIMAARKRMAEREGSCLLVNLQPQIEQVLEIIKALPNVNIFATVKELDDYLLAQQQKVVDRRGLEPRPMNGGHRGTETRRTASSDQSSSPSRTGLAKPMTWVAPWPTRSLPQRVRQDGQDRRDAVFEVAQAEILVRAVLVVVGVDRPYAHRRYPEGLYEGRDRN